MTKTHQTSRLRYLEPARVAIAGVRCTGMRFCDTKGHTLGRIHGFIVDPVARRLRYFVICTSRLLGRVQLVRLTAARVDVSERLIELRGDRREVDRSLAFRPKVFPVFSDDDLLTALFGSSSDAGAPAAA